MKIIKFSLAFITVCVVAVTIGLIRFDSWSNAPILKGDQKIEFNIAEGSNLRQCIEQINEAGANINPWLLEAKFRIAKKTGKIKAGTYSLESGETPTDLFNKLVNGDYLLVKLTVVEGWTFVQMRNFINQFEGIAHDTLSLSHQELLEKIGAKNHTQPEGLFFPATYSIPKGTSELVIFKQAYELQQKKLKQLWDNRDQQLPYKTPYEALIMASIIEKETGATEDRNLVAAVFVNRLRIGMLLQTDPTVIYGMGDRYQGKIRKVDLQTDTPYNTYTRAGLPPTPIALPGEAALSAAFSPAKSDVLYFVARGDGTSQFSKNLSDHNHAVEKYIRNKNRNN